MKFSCPGCGVTLKVSEDQIGRKFRCPKCRQPVRVGRPMEEAANVTSGEVTASDPAFPDESPPVDEAPVGDPDGDPWEALNSENGDWESTLGELRDDGSEDAVVDPPPVLAGRRRTSMYSKPIQWGSVHAKRDRFWVLQGIVSWGYVCAALVVLLFVAAGLYFGYRMSQLGDGLPYGIATMLLCWLLGILIVLPYLAYIQLLDCFLAIEENTRRAADR